MAGKLILVKGVISIKVCVITDNEYLYRNFVEIIKSDFYQNDIFEFFFSFCNSAFLERYKHTSFGPVNLREKDESFFSQFDIFFSLHSKQIFPDSLVNHHICINIHPGYNPYNRGWYPQVFSIINKKPVGVTIHKMDEQLDHGPILFQQEVEIFEHDTSFDVYQRIQITEIAMLTKYLPTILHGNYICKPMCGNGNLNTRQDFKALCELNLEQTATYGEVIDHLRAVTFPGYWNAFFKTEDGHKIYVTLKLEIDNDEV